MLQLLRGFPDGSVVKNPPAKQEMWVQSLGDEDPLGEGNGNPLQYSCLGNPTGREAWQATVHRVAESQAASTEAWNARMHTTLHVPFFT